MTQMKTIEVPDYIKGLIFDCDGTLVDSMPLHMKAWEHAITTAGGIWNYDFIFSKKGMQGNDILDDYNRMFGANLDVESTARIKQEYFHTHCAEIKPIEAVVDVVRRYASRLPMAVASGGSEENVLLSLELTGIKHYFQVIITAGDKDVLPKPSPDIFLEAAKRIHIPPQYCQVFEDGDIGLEAARKAGMLATDIRGY
ncbi:MAG: HAD family phosphatase [Ignavibacteriae bacterium]|nr:MAG: HAD family phosphatase [Ignavibacteriota bacterium]